MPATAPGLLAGTAPGPFAGTALGSAMALLNVSTDWMCSLTQPSELPVMSSSWVL